MIITNRSDLTETVIIKLLLKLKHSLENGFSATVLFIEYEFIYETNGKQVIYSVLVYV